MLGAVLYGLQSDDLGTELLAAIVGLGLIFVGRSIEGRKAGPG